MSRCRIVEENWMNMIESSENNHRRRQTRHTKTKQPTARQSVSLCLPKKRQQQNKQSKVFQTQNFRAQHSKGVKFLCTSERDGSTRRIWIRIRRTRKGWHGDMQETGTLCICISLSHIKKILGFFDWNRYFFIKYTPTTSKYRVYSIQVSRLRQLLATALFLFVHPQTYKYRVVFYTK